MNDIRKIVSSILEGVEDIKSLEDIITVNNSAEKLHNEKQVEYLHKIPTDKTEMASVISSMIISLNNDIDIPSIFIKLSNLINAEKESQIKNNVKIKLEGHDLNQDENDSTLSQFGFPSTQIVFNSLKSAINKYKFHFDISNNDKEFIILGAMDDYIKFLKSNNEISNDDEQLLRNNPTIIQDLKGFKKHLNKFLLNGMKKAAKNDEVEAVNTDTKI